jgi:hypothetical protein
VLAILSSRDSLRIRLFGPHRCTLHPWPSVLVYRAAVDVVVRGSSVSSVSKLLTPCTCPSHLPSSVESIRWAVVDRSLVFVAERIESNRIEFS